MAAIERQRWRHALRWIVYDLGLDATALAEREKIAWDLLTEWGKARGLVTDPAYNGECFRSTWDYGRRESFALGFLGTPCLFTEKAPRLRGFGVTGEEVLEGKEEDATEFLVALGRERA